MIDRYLLGKLLNNDIHGIESLNIFEINFKNYLKNIMENPNSYGFHKSFEKITVDIAIYHGQLQVIIESDKFCGTQSIHLNYIPFVNLNISSALLNIYRITCLEDVDLDTILKNFKKTLKRKQIKFEHVNLFDGSVDQNILKINLTDNEKIDFFYNTIKVLESDLNLNRNISKEDFI